MAGAKFIIDDSDVRARLKQMSNLDTADMLDEVGSHMVSVITRRFRTSTGPDGQQWLPSERAVETDGKTLVDRGHLRDSVTYVVGRSQVAIGTNIEYGAIHQFGGQAGRGRKVTLPARPYLGISGQDNAEIQDIMGDYIQGVIDR